MRAVIQRVCNASVAVASTSSSTETRPPRDQVVGSIDRGLLVLLGVEKDDNQQDLNYLFNKTIGLRIFEDADQKMNLSLTDIGGQLLVVSQFTLLGDVQKGKRPSFINAADPATAKCLYEAFVQLARDAGIETATGMFQTDMAVSLVNDGPVTILLDSRKRF